MFEHMSHIPLLQLIAASNVLVIRVTFRDAFDTLVVSCILFPLKAKLSHFQNTTCEHFK